MRYGSFSSVLFTLTVLLFASSVWELNDIDRQAAYSAEPEASVKSLNPPLGVPSSTDVTGVVEGAHLPTTQPEVLWTASSLNDNGRYLPLSDPALADGFLYVGDIFGRMMAFRTADQKTIWTHAHGSQIRATPSIDHEFVYFGSLKGITVIRRDNGEQVWNRPFEGGAADCSPIIVDDRVYVSASDGNAYCLNRKNGETLWKGEFLSDGKSAKDINGPEADEALPPHMKARPMGSASNGSLFLQSVFDQARVIAFDCETGERRWTFQAECWVGPAPTIYEGRVYFTSESNDLYCIEIDTGKLVWQFKSPAFTGRSRVAIHREKVYLPVYGAKIIEIDADKGKELRTFEPSDPADRTQSSQTFPLIANDVIYFATERYGQLFAFDLQSGDMLWKIQPVEGSTMQTAPKTDGTQIYVKTYKTQANGKSVIAVKEK